MENQAITVQLPALAGQAVPAQAESDERLVELWLHGKAAKTQAAYRADLAAFRTHVGGKPIRAITLGDLQSFADSMADRAPAGRACRLAAIKSLLTFAQKLGAISFNVGGALRLPKIEGRLAERILDEDAVLRMLAMEHEPRNAAILRLLYLGGLRISELAGLTWRNLQPSNGSGQITVYGKGGRTRAVLLKPSLWRQLAAQRGNRGPDEPVFMSSKARGKPLDVTMIHRIVKRAAARAGLSPDVSAHWLRHAHVSHALNHGAPAHLVQATVGHASLITTSRYAHAKPDDSSSLYLPG